MRPVIHQQCYTSEGIRVNSLNDNLWSVNRTSQRNDNERFPSATVRATILTVNPLVGQDSCVTQ